jgi:hypothetical protein
MKFTTARANDKRAAFTLAEVMAALLFLAIVIPTAVLQVASRAGEVATRKSAAMRVADRVLNESLVMTNWTSGNQSGTAGEGLQQYDWHVTSQAWSEDAMQMVTAEVKYSVQGREYSVKLSTLASLPGQTQTTATTQ